MTAAPGTVRPLVVDTDGGVDDAIALMMLVAHGRVPALITTVFGNVGLAQATQNILAVLAVAEVEVPVHAGAARPLTGALIDATYVHGDDGLGGAPRPAVTAAATSTDAVGTLLATLRGSAARGEPMDVLTLGPLTNLALALRLDPAIAAGIGRLVIMGGTCHGRGNTTPAAEFNIIADPEAADIVFGTDLDTVMVPWEPCLAHAVPGSRVDAALRETGDRHPGSHLWHTVLAALSTHGRGNSKTRRGIDELVLPDPLAVAVLLDPFIATRSVRAGVTVALSEGVARGMTVVDPSGRLGRPAVTVVEAADADRLAIAFATTAAHRPSRSHPVPA